ncbi:MAG TPA: hypothetical protein VN231_09185 [Allosphingosinicella sp.]|nr:hypothetical protein [Allosphingosinicella sp.]
MAYGVFTDFAGSPPVIASDVVEIHSDGYTVDGVGAAWYIYDDDVTSTTVAANPRTQFLADDGRGFRLSTEQTVTDYMFGALNGDDNADALEAWSLFAWGSRCLAAACISTGTSDRPVTLGGSGHSQTKSLRFGLQLWATAEMNVLLTIRNFRYSTADFAGCEIRGANSGSEDVALASRLAKVGLEIVNGSRTDMTGVVTVYSCYYWGVALDPTGASNFARLPYIRALNCGSAPMAGGDDVLTANWSSPVRGGSAGSLAQTTTLTVDAVPAASDPAGMQRCVKIAGYYYRIDSITGSGPYTMTLSMPWLDPVSYNGGSGSGTLEYVFGGMLALRGTDTSRLNVAGDSLRCGFALLDQALYGADIRFLGSHQTEVYLGFGHGINGAQNGGKLHGGYIENATTAQILSFSNASSDREMSEVGGQDINFAMWFKHGPRNGSELLVNQRLAEFANVAGAEGFLPIAQQGFAFTAAYDPPSIAAGGSASTTVTIPNATLGTALQAQFSESLSGLMLLASVTSVAASGNATATATFFNPTGGAVNPAAGTLTLKVRR